MEIKAIIVDDEAHCRDGLSALLVRRFPEVKLVGTAADVPSGLDLAGRTRPDLIFLDVEMPPHTGFELLQSLGPDQPHVIFTTAHESHALKAIRFSAMDFLLKPVDADELANALAKVKEALRKPRRPEKVMALLNNLSRTPDGRIAIPTDDGLRYLVPSEVLYMEHTGDAIEVSLADGGTLQMERTLKECEDLLGPSGFIRVQRTCLINAGRVHGMKDGTVTMENGKAIAIDGRKEEALRQLLQPRPHP